MLSARIAQRFQQNQIKLRLAINHCSEALQRKRPRMPARQRLKIDRRLSGATYRWAFFNPSPAARWAVSACKQCDSRHALMEGQRQITPEAANTLLRRSLVCAAREKKARRQKCPPKRSCEQKSVQGYSPADCMNSGLRPAAARNPPHRWKHSSENRDSQENLGMIATTMVRGPIS